MGNSTTKAYPHTEKGKKGQGRVQIQNLSGGLAIEGLGPDEVRSRRTSSGEGREGSATDRDVMYNCGGSGMQGRHRTVVWRNGR